MNALTCPKCQGQMRSYERSGVTVDQCGECRGIFLDRGELERLVDMENAHYAAPPPQQQQQQEQPRYNEPRREYYEEPPRQPFGGYGQGGYGHGHHGKHGKHRRKSIFEELFD